MDYLIGNTSCLRGDQKDSERRNTLSCMGRGEICFASRMSVPVVMLRRLAS